MRVVYACHLIKLFFWEHQLPIFRFAVPLYLRDVERAVRKIFYCLPSTFLVSLRCTIKQLLYILRVRNYYWAKFGNLYGFFLLFNFLFFLLLFVLYLLLCIILAHYSIFILIIFVINGLIKIFAFFLTLFSFIILFL